MAAFYTGSDNAAAWEAECGVNGDGCEKCGGKCAAGACKVFDDETTPAPTTPALISPATRATLVATLASERARLNTAYAAHAAQEDLYGEDDAHVAKCWARVERIREEVQRLEDTLLALDPGAPEALEYMTGRRKVAAILRIQDPATAVPF